MSSPVLQNNGPPEEPTHIQSPKTIQDLQESFHRILAFLPGAQNRKNLRLVSRYWNAALTDPAADGPKLIFTFDGNSEANEEPSFLTNVVDYFIRSGWANVTHAWKALCVKNASFWQLTAWIQEMTIGHVRTVEFKNCSIHLNELMDFLSQFVNMESFTYKLNPGPIDFTNGPTSAHAHYQRFENPEILQHLENLKTLNICTGLDNEIPILQLFNSYCTSIQNLSIRIKQGSNDAKTSSKGAWTTENLSTLLQNVGTTLQKNHLSLKTLHLAFDGSSVMHSEVHISERLFMIINELRWDAIEFPTLESASISYPAELNCNPGTGDQDLPTYFLRFLRHLIRGRSLKTLEIGTLCINQQHTYKRLVDELERMKALLNPTLSIKLGVFLEYDLDERFENDKVLGESLSSMVIESSVKVGRIGRVLTNSVAPNLQRLSILNRTSSLTDYGLSTITTKYYSSLRILEIDSASSTTTCPAKIDDDEIQGIFRDLLKLETLRLSVNMEDVGDSGLTGLRKCTCELYNNSVPGEKLRQLLENEPRGYPISNLKALRHLLLRGVGERVTNLTFFFGLDNMLELRDLTIIGKHKITAFGISYLKQRTGNANLVKIITSAS